MSLSDKKILSVRIYIKKVEVRGEKPNKLLFKIQWKEGKKKIEGTIQERAAIG
jgi:hypothetical protein